MEQVSESVHFDYSSDEEGPMGHIGKEKIGRAQTTKKSMTSTKFGTENILKKQFSQAFSKDDI